MNISHLYFSYLDKHIFEDLSLSIESGITCILGESGAGKTTLLDLIAGLREYRGDIDKVEYSYMFQSPLLFGYLTVSENLSLIGATPDDILATLASLGIGDKVDRYPHELSGGEKARVSLARVYLHDKSVWLLDEPLSSVDLSSRRDILDDLKQRSTQKTILYITHDIDEALYIADRLIVLKNGAVSYDERLANTDEYGMSAMRPTILNLMLHQD